MTLLASIFLGVVTHATFHFYEPRSPLTPVISTTTILPLCIIAYNGSWVAYTVISVYATYFASLCASIALYRLSPLHPLAAYPGPVMFKVTKLAGAWASWSGRQHLILKSLHDAYGPVVRIGPNDISMVDTDAIIPVLGTNGLPKGRYYDARRDPNAPRNLLSMEPGEVHTKRRRLWNRGLSNDSLKDYEDIIAKRARELVDGLERHTSEALDIVAWINYFTFDFMGDMAFGEGYGMLHDGGDKSSYWELIERFALVAAVICHVPWTNPLLQRIPPVAKDLLTLRKFGLDSATTRIKRGATAKDLWYYLGDEPGLEPEKPPLKEVVADGVLAIVAGADTTASAMSSLLYFLLTNNNCMARLQEEIDRVYPDPDYALNSSKLGELKYLNACINETLRLHPPVPTGGPRQVMKGSGSKIIAGRVIPEHTQIYIPPYVLQRESRYYPDAPNAFKPERWLNSGDSSGSAAFMPFSYGPANCVGRHLARREMMMVIPLLVKKFNIEFVEGFDVRAWPGTLHDYFVSSRGPLLVRLHLK